MVQARRSSARISACRGLPRSVRSPAITSTLATFDISLKSSRWRLGASSFAWRSAMAATLSAPFPSAMTGRIQLLSRYRICTHTAEVGEAPFLDVDLVIDSREHPPTANIGFRNRQLEL